MYSQSNPLKKLSLFCLAALAGCKTISIDPSMSAVAAGDLSLVLSACEAVPSRGADICRVKENTKIESAWRVFLPKIDGRIITAGEMTVFYKDVVRTYPVVTNVVEMPWSDITGNEFWSKDLAGQALALGEIRYKNPQGIEEIITVRGQAILLVLSAGYSSYAIDSGYDAFPLSCRISYTTAGRSSVLCR